MDIKCPNCNNMVSVKNKGNASTHCKKCGCLLKTVNGWMYAFDNDELMRIDFMLERKKKRRINRKYLYVAGGIVIFIIWFFVYGLMAQTRKVMSLIWLF